MGFVRDITNKDPISRKVNDALGFNTPPPAPPAVPPAAPTMNSAAVQDAGLEERRKRAGKGRASTMLTGADGVEDDDPGTKMLLGAGY